MDKEEYKLELEQLRDEIKELKEKYQSELIIIEKRFERPMSEFTRAIYETSKSCKTGIMEDLEELIK